jgi:hypothetical protein
VIDLIKFCGNTKYIELYLMTERVLKDCKRRASFAHDREGP